ncbi:hypothetical protein [Faecalibaculum rodentium]|nr:hypothetical protein [Faecalibaculum rodentium]
MAWYEVKYACGHTGQVQLYGKTDSREWRLHQMEHEDCPECCKKAREEADRKAAEENAADGLPALTGTEKQVLWAEKIRHDILDGIDKAIKDSEEEFKQEQAAGTVDENDRSPEAIEAAKKAYFEMQQESSARWWIDHRSLNHFEELTKKYFENPEEKSPEIIEPEESTHEGVADVTVTPTHVETIFDINEDFRKVVKSMGYTWSGVAWIHGKTIGVHSLDDLAADTVNQLVKAGFRVKVSPEVADMVKTGHFTASNQRRVYLKDRRFEFCFEQDEALLKVAKSLPRSNDWEKEGFYWVTTPVWYAEAAYDFADTYGFSIGPKAAAKMEEVIQAHKEKIKPKEADVIPADAIYHHDETEVIPDLVDED